MKTAFSSSPVLLALTAATIAAASIACQQSVSTTSGDENDIVGGKESTPGAWPGTVALYAEWGGDEIQICGGALIADEWVLTAAHCIIPDAPIKNVIIDRHDLTTTVGESIAVKKATRHPAYNSSTHNNDLAILQLASKAHGAPTKLLGSQQASTLADGSTVTVVGWGNTSESGSSSSVLREVDVPVIGTAACQAFPHYDIVNDNQICAGFTTGGKDSCQGDSGGPLFFKIGTEIYHAGLTSWGVGCARPNAPGVYTRTSTYVNWIFKTTGGAAGEAPPASDGGTDGGAFTPFKQTGSVLKNEEKAYSFDAPPGDYTVAMEGTNDADLYVKVDSAPTTSSFDCRPYENGTAESCVVSLASAGKIFVMVRGYSTAASDFTVTGEQL
jgi:serine protease